MKTTCNWQHILKSPEYHQGIRDTLPLMVGVFPFGITLGIMAAAASLRPWETIFMSLSVFAGAAQFVAVNMMAEGINNWELIVFTTLLINLRHLLMGASLIPYILKLPLPLQLILAFGMADEMYAVTVDRIYRQGYDARYQLGTSTAGYVTWTLSTAVGVWVGCYIPDPLAWGLDFAMPATFLVLLMPRLASTTGLAVFTVAAAIALAGSIYLPGKWYIIAACLAAALVGGVLEGETANEN